MDKAKVMEVLRRVEWVGGYDHPCCEWCHSWKSEGHAGDCKLAALLDEAGAVKVLREASGG